MVILGVVAALLFAILPVAVVVALTSRRGHAPWQLALNIPAAVACDLVVVTLVARLMPLDVAAWVTRGLWLAGGIFGWRALVARGQRPQLPAEVTTGTLARALATGALALAVSLTLSRPCAIWDRYWHIPLVTSFRGEHAPFVPVYQPWKVLFYHYGGDVVPATLQSYSFGILHASHALSLVHDLAFFLFGCCVSFIVTSAGARRLWQSALVALAMLLSGPLVKFWDGSTRPLGGGYSLPDFLNTSYRPHVSLAALFMLPFVALPLGRLRDDARELSVPEALFPLAACAMALLVTDEFSLGLLGLSLGVMWLVRPQILGADRKAGVLVLAGLAAAVGFAFFVLKGTVGPGAPHYALKLMPPSSPGFYTPALPLTTARGRVTFVLDLMGVLGVLVGGVIIAAGRRDRATLVSVLGYAVVSVAGTWMFATFTYNGDGLQNHRFQTAPMLLGPLFAALWLFWSVERRALAAKLLGGLVLVATLGAGFFSTARWIVTGTAIEDTRNLQGFPGRDRFYYTDCRSAVGAQTVYTKTKTAYVDPAVLYLYAGCRPVFLSGPPQNMDGHDLKEGADVTAVGAPRLGMGAFVEVSTTPRFLDVTEDLLVVCTPGFSTDPVCQFAKSRGACHSGGTAVDICSMSPADRMTLLSRPH